MPTEPDLHTVTDTAAAADGPGGPAGPAPSEPDWDAPLPDRFHRRRRAPKVIAGLVALVVVAGAGWWIKGKVNQPVLGTGCTAVAGGRSVDLDPEQAGNAATITGVAVHRHLPARAATIALATALQESKLRNVSYGDRDSLGLFQQRPSQGWGTRAQVLDPVYASNAFYDVLVKIEGYRNLPVTKVAQKVQRSAYPSAYAAHEDDARVLASALSGYSPDAFTCSLPPVTAKGQSPGASGLTPRAEALRATATKELGATASPIGTRGTTLDLSLPASDAGPTAETSATDAWAIAQWAVGRAQGLDIVAVTTAGRTWSRGDHPDRWTSGPTNQLAVGHVAVQVR